MAMMRCELPQDSLSSTNIKIVLVGESGVGKTSISVRFWKDHFTDRHELTLGAAFASKRLWVEDRLVKLHIWDTGGQERFHSMAPMYYRGAHAALIVYDVTKKATFDRVQDWLNEIRRHTRVCPFMFIVGNKMDCNAERQVLYEDGHHLADKNCITFFETSAKENTNIDELFRTAAEHSLGNLATFRSITLGESIRPKSEELLAEKSQSRSGCHCAR